MLQEPSFTSLMTDFTGSRATTVLEQIVAKLEGIRDTLDFGMSRSDLTLANIRSLEEDVRGILKEIATSPDIKKSLRNPDAVLNSLRSTIKKLNLAKDALDMKKTLKLREQLYDYYDEAYKCICLAICGLQDRRSS